MAIPPAGEAAHVIDGLLYHEADVSIAVHHTDGGGASDHVFALAALLGFRFAPRIPNLAERRLYAFGPASRWTALAPFIAQSGSDSGVRLCLFFSLDQPSGDGQAHDSARDLVLGMLWGKRLDHLIPASRQTVAEQLEDCRRNAGHHRMRVVGGRCGEWGMPVR